MLFERRRRLANASRLRHGGDRHAQGRDARSGGESMRYRGLLYIFTTAATAAAVLSR